MGRITVQLTGDEARLLKSLDKVVQKEKDLAKAAEKTGQKSAAASKKAKAGHAEQSISIKQVIDQYVTAAAAIGVMTKALRTMHEERKKAATEVVQGAGAVGQLGQLTGGDPAEMRRMVNELKKTMREEGLTRTAAAELQFALESGGLASKRELFASLAPLTKRQPGGVALGVATLRNALGQEAGTPEEILNKLLAASAVSQTTLGQFAPTATIAAQGQRQLGGTTSELLAVLAQLTQATKSPEAAGTQVSSFITALTGTGLKGKGFDVTKITGIMQAVQAISDLNIPKEELQSVLGNVRAKRGFLAIQGLVGAIKLTEEQITAAAPSQLYKEAVAATLSEAPVVKAERRLAIAASEEALAYEDIGVGEVGREARLGELRVGARGRGALTRAGLSTIRGGAAYLGAPEDILEPVGEAGTSALPGAIPGMPNQPILQGLINAIWGNTEAVKKNTEGTPPKARQRNR